MYVLLHTYIQMWARHLGFASPVRGKELLRYTALYCMVCVYLLYGKQFYCLPDLPLLVQSHVSPPSTCVDMRASGCEEWQTESRRGDQKAALPCTYNISFEPRVNRARPIRLSSLNSLGFLDLAGAFQGIPPLVVSGREGYRCDGIERPWGCWPTWDEMVRMKVRSRRWPGAAHAPTGPTTVHTNNKRGRRPADPGQDESV